MAHYFTRQALYDLVWKEPRQQLAKRFHISDVGLAKLCAKADIPMPSRGYWAKKAAGNSTTMAALPPRGLGQSDQVIIGRPVSGDRINDALAPLPDPPHFPEPMNVVRDRALQMLGKVRLPSLQKDTHRLIAALLEEDDSRRTEMAQYGHSWKKPVFDSPDAKRQLRLLNALFLAFARAGGKPTLYGMEEMGLGVEVGDTHVSFKLVPLSGSRAAGQRQQKSHRVKMKLAVNCWWDTSSESGFRWQDSDQCSLEDQLTDMAAGILVAGELQYRAGELRRYQSLVERKAAADEAARKKREEDERIVLQKQLAYQKQQRDWLLHQAESLRQATEIRGLVQAMEAHPQLKGASPMTLEFQNWRSWALSIASDLDPLERPLGYVLRSDLP